ncbi:MAG TPA: hypothetical protein VKY27_04585 [Bacteriovoracaceae bacterium]|nr:hypothetical protein [Bacteriovoracaceae bacterium]
MLYPNTDAQEWSKLYSLTPQYKECPCCGKEFLTTIPVAIKGYRGLQTEVHECGDDGVVTILVPVDEAEKDKWEKLLFA